MALFFLHYFLAHTVWCLAAVLGQCHSPTGEANLFLVSPAAGLGVLPLFFGRIGLNYLGEEL